MESFTGPEIAAMCLPGCIISAHPTFSDELSRQLLTMPAMLRADSAYEHWIRGVYLITEVKADDGRVAVPLEDDQSLDRVRGMLDDAMEITLRGAVHRVAAAGSLDGVEAAALPAALAALTAPATVVLQNTVPRSSGDDSIVALNLTRRCVAPPPGFDHAEAVAPVVARYPGAASVRIDHYLGGPCDPEEIVGCLVAGGAAAPGWTAVKSLTEAVELAHARSASRHAAQGDIGGGQPVELTGLKARPELNGEVGIAGAFQPDSGR